MRLSWIPSLFILPYSLLSCIYQAWTFNEFTVRDWRPGTPGHYAGLRVGPNYKGPGQIRQASNAEHVNKYFWPSARGHPRNYSHSLELGPQNLNEAYSWSFHHPDGWFHLICMGVVMDENINLYLSCDDSIRKFSPDGELLWRTVPTGSIPRPTPPQYWGQTNMATTPSLMDGALFGSIINGYAFSLDMVTGKEIWSVKAGDSAVNDHQGDDNNFVGAHAGIVIMCKNRCWQNPPCPPQGGSLMLVALNSTNGDKLWDFTPDGPFWNFFPLFNDDGTFAFQDMEGRAYRVHLHDGKLIWKGGGNPHSWTDGTAMLGSNGLVYAVTDDVNFGPDTPGTLSAFRFSDGELMWKARVPRPPCNWPLVGHFPGKPNLSVIIPVGAPGGGPNPADLIMLDAESGKNQHIYFPATTNSAWGGGDAAGGPTRGALGYRPGCGPNAWSSPTMDAEGAIYIGYQDGSIYRIFDANGDGYLDKSDPKEVNQFFTGAFASPAGGSALGRGIMAHVSCDGLFVFRHSRKSGVY